MGMYLWFFDDRISTWFANYFLNYISYLLEGLDSKTDQICFYDYSHLQHQDKGYKKLNCKMEHINIVCFFSQLGYS